MSGRAHPKKTRTSSSERKSQNSAQSCAPLPSGRALGRPSPVAMETETDFVAGVLRQHNIKRTIHNVAPLKMDDTLTEFARSYANQLAEMDRMLHSNGPYGENLYYYWKIGKDDSGG